MKKFIRDTNAVTPTYEYIILTGIMIIYITLFLTLYADEFGIAPMRIAMQTQFEDVGNDISSKVVDMYVIAPESGYLKTRFYMPEAVGKYEYKVEFNNNSGLDQILVSALRFEKEVMINLNKMGSSLGLNGSTYSASPEHWLKYSPPVAQFNLTPIAIVYSREAVYNPTTNLSEIITFDGSDTKGIGELKFTWDFGDGNTSTNPTEYHQYSSEGIYNVTLTVYDPILERSASSSIQVKVTSSYINPSLDGYKYVSPKSFKAGKPSYTSIVLYGKGIFQNESHLDVMLTLDRSGSMDPDTYRAAGYDENRGYTPISNVSLNDSVGSNIWNQTFNLTNETGETIEKLYVELWNVSGNNNIDLWVKPPSGTAERAQNITPSYERYEKANPVLGTYTIYVLGDFPLGSQQFKVNVNKTSNINISGAVVTNFTGTVNATKPPRWDNIENPFLINESLANYKIEMNYFDEFGSRPLRLWVSRNGSTPALAAGLMGEYYDNSDFTELRVTRLDAVVNFNWGTGSPHPDIGSNTFSARWTGYVMVDHSENYTFYVVTNDGSRVWVNDTLIIDSWTNKPSAIEINGTINLASGWHKIKYEYYENTGSATAQLLYSSPGTPKQVIPQDHLTPGNVSLDYANVPAGTNYTVYVTGTFPDSTQNFTLQTYMAKLDAAKITGKFFVDMLNSSSDKSGLVSFGGDVRLDQTLTQNHSLVKNGIDNLNALGGTPTGDAIRVATNELNSSSEYFTKNNRARVPVIILLSDGLPNIPTSETVAIQYAYDQANIAKNKGILIYTIGFGVDVNMTVLAKISSGKGYYFFAASKEELQDIYTQIVKELREIAARDLVITDVVPAGIEVVSVPGADSITKNADGTTTIVWKLDKLKIYAHGQTPVVKQLVISTMNTGSTTANVFNLSNVTYTNVVTGNLTTFIFPQTYISVSTAAGGQMSLE